METGGKQLVLLSTVVTQSAYKKTQSPPINMLYVIQAGCVSDYFLAGSLLSAHNPL